MQSTAAAPEPAFIAPATYTATPAEIKNAISLWANNERAFVNIDINQYGMYVWVCVCVINTQIAKDCV